MILCSTSKGRQVLEWQIGKGVHLRKGAQPVQRPSGGKGGPGMSEGGALSEGAGFQRVCVEKVVGDHPFGKYELNTYYVPDSTVSAGDTAMDKIGKNPTLMGLTF